MDWTCVSRASDSDSGVWIYIVYLYKTGKQARAPLENTRW